VAPVLAMFLEKGKYCHGKNDTHMIQ